MDDNLRLHKEEFLKAIEDCDKKGYRYAVSNPLFEAWLLLHHDDVNDSDIKHAVTAENNYAYDAEVSAYFRDRLNKLQVSLKKKKHITENHYDIDKIRKASERAKQLVVSADEKFPENIGSHFYKIIDEIEELYSIMADADNWLTIELE